MTRKRNQAAGGHLIHRPTAYLQLNSTLSSISVRVLPTPRQCLVQMKAQLQLIFAASLATRRRRLFSRQANRSVNRASLSEAPGFQKPSPYSTSIVAWATAVGIGIFGKPCSQIGRQASEMGWSLYRAIKLVNDCSHPCRLVA